MADQGSIANLKQNIDDNIYQNTAKEITGGKMNTVLQNIVDTLTKNGFKYLGIANPTTNPGIPDQDVYYWAFEPGIYSNFNGYELFDGELVIFKYHTNWQADVIDIVNDLLFRYKSEPISRISRLTGKRFDSSGNIVDQSYFAIDLFSVQAGDIYKLVGTTISPTNSYEYVIYNSTTTQNSTTAIVVGPSMVEDFTADLKIPTGGVILAVQSYVSNEKIVTTKYKSIFTYIDQLANSLSDEIETTDEELFGEHLIGVSATRENGYHIRYNGEIMANEYGSIYRIAVNAGEKYRITQANQIGSTGQYTYAVYSNSTPNTDSLLLIGPEFNSPMTADITIPENGVLLVWGRVINYTQTVQKYEKYSRITAIEEEMATKRLFLQYDSNGVKVNQKYSNQYDIQYWLRQFGVNNLLQLYAHGFISNETVLVSQSDPASYTTSGSDWIGPYIMSALENPTSENIGFTGGCHGSNGDQTGDPTAETLDIKVYADNRLVSSGTTIVCDDVRVVVTNRIHGGNTNGVNGRNILEEIVTYHFKNNKIYVSVCSQALEDLRVSTYYGMQMNNYNQSAMFFGKNTKAGTFTPSTSFAEKTFLGVGTDANGRMCSMHLESVGLGCNEHTDTSKYCFTSGAKMYYSLINSNNTLTLNANEKMYWAGWYQFTDVLKLDELTN